MTAVNRWPVLGHAVTVTAWPKLGQSIKPLGRFVPRGNRCHVGRSVPLTQHAMELSDDE